MVHQSTAFVNDDQGQQSLKAFSLLFYERINSGVGFQFQHTVFWRLGRVHLHSSRAFPVYCKFLHLHVDCIPSAHALWDIK